MSNDDHLRGMRGRLWLLYAVCVLASSWISIHQYRSFRSVWPRDLAHVNQAAWCLTHDVPVLSIRPHNHYAAEGPEPLRSVHLDPIRYLLLPVYRLYPYPETLLAGQSVIFWLSLFGVARLARERAWMAACLWAITPAAFGLVLNDFRTMELGFPFLLWAIAAFERRQAGWLFIHALLACSARQEYGVAIGLLALMPALPGEHSRVIWRWRALVLLWTAGWFLLYVGYTYILFGPKSTEILLKTPAQRPPESWEMWLTDATRLVISLLILLGGWWLYIPSAPRLLMMSAPFFYMISRYSNHRFMPGDDHWHMIRYFAIPLAYCVAGGAIGMRGSKIARWSLARRAALIVGLWIAPLLLCILSVSRMGYLSDSDVLAARGWIEKIPDDAWVFSDAHFVAMVSSRAMVRDAYDYEHDDIQVPPEVDAWAILFGGTAGDARSPRFLAAGYQMVFQGEHITIVRRGRQATR